MYVTPGAVDAAVFDPNVVTPADFCVNGDYGESVVFGFIARLSLEKVRSGSTVDGDTPLAIYCICVRMACVQLHVASLYSTVHPDRDEYFSMCVLHCVYLQAGGCASLRAPR